MEQNKKNRYKYAKIWIIGAIIISSIYLLWLLFTKSKEESQLEYIDNLARFQLLKSLGMSADSTIPPLNFSSGQNLMKVGDIIKYK